MMTHVTTYLKGLLRLASRFMQFSRQLDVHCATWSVRSAGVRGLQGQGLQFQVAPATDAGRDIMHIFNTMRTLFSLYCWFWRTASIDSFTMLLTSSGTNAACSDESGFGHRHAATRSQHAPPFRDNDQEAFSASSADLLGSDVLYPLLRRSCRHPKRLWLQSCQAEAPSLRLNC